MSADNGGVIPSGSLFFTGDDGKPVGYCGACFADLECHLSEDGKSFTVATHEHRWPSMAELEDFYQRAKKLNDGRTR